MTSRLEAEATTGGIAISIGVDVGGTFTDVLVIAETQGTLRSSWVKVPSTPAAPAEGVINGVLKGLADLNLPLHGVSNIRHGSTIATNAILEQKGARTAIVTTRGFEDTLEIGRQSRSQMYDVFLEPETPVFIAPRERRFGVRERIGADGSIIQALDLQEARAIRDRLESLGVEAIAICYLFSFANPEHELLTNEIMRQSRQNIAVSLSHEVNPTFREYERTCVTAFDAYLRPVVEGYLKNLYQSLRQREFIGSLQMMKSRGGLASIEGAIRRPVTTILSGPAAGVVGARAVALAAGVSKVITLDMGGTSADVAVITPTKPLTTTAGRIGRYPLSIPLVDVQTIGAGGGSIAWMDAGGGFRVGPQSAGSYPGPACYGLGGHEPTVTDASVLLGYLDPKYFAGGTQALDPDLAEHAIRPLAAKLGMSATDVALGIHRIANAKMAAAIRLASVKRGYDIRGFTLMAFGGAGPVNAALVAEDLGVTRCLIPRGAGVLCALGLLLSNVEYDNSHGFLKVLAPPSLDHANELLSRLSELGAQQMRADGYSDDQYFASYFADMRFVGQSSELEVPLPSVRLRVEDIDTIRSVFEQHHERAYGYVSRGAPIEWVALRTVHIRPPDLSVREILAAERDAGISNGGDALKECRECVFPSGRKSTPVYYGACLPSEFRVEGPAIVQEQDTTIVIYPGYSAALDQNRNLVIELGTGPAPNLGTGRA